MTATEAAASPGVDLVIVRENTEDLYCGMGGRLTTGGVGHLATDVRVVTRRASEKVIRYAFDLAHLRGGSLQELQSWHVQEFDLSRRHALHLSYWTDGDTRRRGQVLADIKAVYRESGLVVDTGGGAAWGMTVADRRVTTLARASLDADAHRAALDRMHIGPGRWDVAVGVDVAAFRAGLHRWLGGPPVPRRP